MIDLCNIYTKMNMSVQLVHFCRTVLSCCSAVNYLFCVRHIFFQLGSSRRCKLIRLFDGGSGTRSCRNIFSVEAKFFIESSVKTIYPRSEKNGE